jgi:hypothetical protein
MLISPMTKIRQANRKFAKFLAKAKERLYGKLKDTGVTHFLKYDADVYDLAKELYDAHIEKRLLKRNSFIPISCNSVE